MGLPQPNNTKVYEDNTAWIERTQKASAQDPVVIIIPTEFQHADRLTKALQLCQFNTLLNSLLGSKRLPRTKGPTY
jgi:hypothetical protein